MIHRLPITYYSDRIRANDHYSLVRYGDGEFHCMWGRLKKNCDGCRCTAELRRDLWASLCIGGDDPDWSSLIYGLQRILPVDVERVLKETPAITWHDSEIFTEALVAGGLFPLIDALRGRKDLVFVGSPEKLFLRKPPLELPTIGFINIPPSNAHLEKSRILADISKFSSRHGGCCYVFAAGMTANCLISELHGTIPNSFFLDLGHIFDLFCGVRRRRYQRRMTEDEAAALIEANLRPPK